MSESGQQVRDIRPIQDGLQCREQDDVDIRSPRRGDVPRAEEGKDPHQHGCGGKEELRGGGDEDGGEICSGD